MTKYRNYEVYGINILSLCDIFLFGCSVEIISLGY